MLSSYLIAPAAKRPPYGVEVARSNPEIEEEPVEEDILQVSLNLLDSGQAHAADELLTAALLDNPFDERLWLAAGLCRLRRGSLRAAASAFEMSAWLSDDPSARELLHILEEITL